MVSDREPIQNGPDRPIQSEQTAHTGRTETGTAPPGTRMVDLADVFGYGPSAPGWLEPARSRVLP